MREASLVPGSRIARCQRLGPVAFALAALLCARFAAATVTGFTLLYSFSQPDGTYVNGVVLGADGFLYGTTGGGGVSQSGTVFKIKADGTGFELLHSFSQAGGSAPAAGVVLDDSGFLYGTTIAGGAHQVGTVFKIKTDGTGFTVLRSFAGSDGAYPNASLTLDSGGFLYGTTLLGGTGTNCNGSPCGNVFKIKTDGSGFTVLHSFTGPDGNDPWAGLALGADGFLYGTSSGGNITGTCEYMFVHSECGNVFKVKTDGSDFAVLHAFTGPDGGVPYSGLVFDAGGELYGTTTAGGTGTACDFGPCGNVFKINTDGTGFTVLHQFSGTDGSGPNSNLTLDASGKVYGTANAGGVIVSANPACHYGCGTLFSVKTDGTGFTLLHSFTDATSDGQSPNGLIFDGSVYLYGTTATGGANASVGTYAGTVFRFGLATSSAPGTRGDAIATPALSPFRVTGRKH